MAVFDLTAFDAVVLPALLLRGVLAFGSAFLAEALPAAPFLAGAGAAFLLDPFAAAPLAGTAFLAAAPLPVAFASAFVLS